MIRLLYCAILLPILITTEPTMPTPSDTSVSLIDSSTAELPAEPNSTLGFITSSTTTSIESYTTEETIVEESTENTLTTNTTSSSTTDTTGSSTASTTSSSTTDTTGSSTTSTTSSSTTDTTSFSTTSTTSSSTTSTTSFFGQNSSPIVPPSFNIPPNTPVKLETGLGKAATAGITCGIVFSALLLTAEVVFFKFFSSVGLRNDFHSSVAYRA